jgi:hypothetical protein
MWASWVTDTQVLDSASFAPLCPNCRQEAVFSKINNLGAIRANPDGSIRL